MILNETFANKLQTAFADDNSSYAVGFRDALESLVLALQGTIPDGLLVDGMEAALDAYANNCADDDFEDDGQPTEMEEWHDFNPDC